MATAERISKKINTVSVQSTSYSQTLFNFGISWSFKSCSFDGTMEKDKQKLTFWYNTSLWKVNLPPKASWYRSLHMQILNSNMHLTCFLHRSIFIYGEIALRNTHANKNCGGMSP